VELTVVLPVWDGYVASVSEAVESPSCVTMIGDEDSGR
jgi:hypothetical protein